MSMFMLKDEFVKEFGPDIRRGIGRSQMEELERLHKILDDRSRGHEIEGLDFDPQDRAMMAKYIRERLYRTFYHDNIDDHKLDDFAEKLEKGL